MPESIRVSDVIPAPPEAVFVAWLDSGKHTAFTGSRASIDGLGGSFTAWDGYIVGTTLEVDPHRRILQSWRTTEFPAEAPPSRLEVLLEPEVGGTRLTLLHSEIPDGQGQQYEQGWKDHYFLPMKEYFGGVTAFAHDASPVEVKRTAKPAVKKAKKAKPAKKAPKRKAASRTASKRRKPARKAKKKVGGSKRKASSRRGRRR